MSGFEFHLYCDRCGLTSRTYPFRYDRVIEPTTVELPAADRARETFEQVSIAIEKKLAETEIAALAAARSTTDVTVFVPQFGNDEHDIVLVPSASCPRCGNEPIGGRYGHRAEPALPIDRLDQAIDASRTDGRGGALSFRLVSPTAGIRCVRSEEEGSTVFNWYVDRVGATDIAPVLEELHAKLIARGSTCDEPKRFRAFARFREYRR